MVVVVVQQDGAPVYQAQETVDLTKENDGKTLFCSLWLSNSPNLNPIDCVVENSAISHLQQPDQGRGRAAAVCRGAARQF